MPLAIKMKPGDIGTNPATLGSGDGAISPQSETRNPGECTLHLFRDKETKEYKYYFEPEGFVIIEGKDVVTINIEIDKESLEWASCHCHDFCSSTTRKNAIKPVKLLDHNQLETTPYKDQTTKIALKISPEEQELIFFGLIIKLWRYPGDNNPKLLLCDPQVGNGPPQSESAPSPLILDFI